MKMHYWPFGKNFSQKFNNLKWPLDDIWPNICWCLICNSTQGSLCPTPMVIQQSMWIQWLHVFFKNLKGKNSQVPWESISVHQCICGYSDQFCKIPHTYRYYIHTGVLRTEWVIACTCSLFLNQVQARQKGGMRIVQLCVVNFIDRRWDDKTLHLKFLWKLLFFHFLFLFCFVL